VVRAVLGEDGCFQGSALEASERAMHAWAAPSLGTLLAWPCLLAGLVLTAGATTSVLPPKLPDAISWCFGGEQARRGPCMLAHDL
jgi:hypothetical protein